MINDIVLAEPERVWGRLLDELLEGEVNRQSIKELANTSTKDAGEEEPLTGYQLKTEGGVHNA